MKNIIAGIFCLLFAGKAIAQQPLYNKNELLKQLNMPRNPFKQAMPAPPLFKTQPVAATPSDTALYVGSNTYGDLYKLPQDNMPCLKAFDFEIARNNFIAPQPLLQSQTSAQQMPNFYAGKPLVFQKPPAK